MSLRFPTRAAGVITALALLSGCGTTSVTEVEARVENDPGVVTVRASQEPAPDTLPFLVQVPIAVRVVMEADSTQAEVLNVFEAYAEDIDDEVVAAVEVVLRDAERRTILATGSGVHAAEDAVDGLVAAQQDETVARYRRELTKYLFGDELRVVDSVEVRLAGDGGYDDVFAAVDRYRNVEGIGPVAVRSGGFELSVDEYGEVTAAKRKLIREAGERFGLRRALISERYGMTLWVDAGDVPAATRYVESYDTYATGRVDVRADE